MVKVKGDDLKAMEIPDDHLKTNITEMFEFDTLLTSMESCGSQLLNALSQLENAPLPLLNDLGKAYAGDSDCAKMMACLSKELNACFLRMTNGMAHIEGLMELIQEVRPRISAAKDAIAARQAAWVAKVNSDRTNGTLKGFSIKEKSTRLKAKYEADELFSTTTLETKETLDNLLSLRWPVTGTALAEFFHCYADIFETPPKLANELYKSAAKLTSMSKTFEEPLCNSSKSLSATQGIDSGHAKSCIGFGLHDNMEVAQTVTSQTLPPSTKVPTQSAKMPAPPSSNMQTPVMPRKLSTTSITLPKFLTGDGVEVWSNSKNAWYPGIVKQIFNAPGSWENYSVPAGSIEVESAVGVKFIRPDRINELRRKALNCFHSKS